MASLIDAKPMQAVQTNGMGQPYAHYEYMSGTTAALGTSNSGVTTFYNKMLSDFRFKTVSTGGETIKVQGTKDGTNFLDLKPVDESTGNPVTSVNLASGDYKLPLRSFGHYRQFKFVKSAAVQTGTVIAAVARPYQTP